MSNWCYYSLSALRPRIHRSVLDQLKELGFQYATKSGISIGIDDMLIPGDKFELVENAEKEVVKVQQQYLDGAITNGERYNKVIAIWSDVTEKVADEMFKAMERRTAKASSTRFTSWRTPARAAPSNRSASFPACAA